jgi:hypothetical protein
VLHNHRGLFYDDPAATWTLSAEAAQGHITVNNQLCDHKFDWRTEVLFGEGADGIEQRGPRSTALGSAQAD